MNIFKKLLSMAVAVLPIAANAQTDVDIKFETQDYQQVGVYDWWEASPFRTGELKGNCRVIPNPFADEPDAANISARVLALQRSRFGSNLFGARIDLKEDQRFELTNQFQYVHALIRKPVAGRSMIIGLGRHNENTPGYAETWADQKEDVVQFTALGNNKAAADKWTDVVFPIKGAGNITIYSLVVVVDCEAPTDLTEDFACFIDNVKVNNSKKSENAVVGDYPACFDNEQEYTRSDRKLNSLTIATEAGTYTKQAKGKLCRTEAFDGYIVAKPGEQVSVKCNYNGTWMHSFFYFDKNKDGKFNTDDELVTYRNGSSGDHSVQQSFVIPEDLAPGIYRLRGKVDWQSTDPAGNPGDADGKNYIIDNGGGMIDVLFNVYNPEETLVSVGSNQRNGTILLADGSEMSDYRHERLTPLTVIPRGAEGFSCTGLIIRHGYNVGIVSDSLQHSNPQYLAVEVSHKDFAADGTYTIPASLIDADVIIEGIMVSGSLPDGPDEPAPDPSATFPYVSPAPISGQWAKGTKAYHIQNGAKEQAWLSLDNAREDGLRLDANDLPEDARGEWVICGTDELGYSFYNVSEGPEYVLGLVGDDKNARVNLVKVGEEGGATTRFDFHENNDGFSFRLHGSEYNCLNSRDQYLALWSNPAAFATDNGSRFTFFFAEDIEGIEPTPDVNTTDQFFTAEQLRDEVARHGKALIGILNVTTTANKYVNGKAYNGTPASATGTLADVRAPQADEVMEVIATEGGYLLRQADADEGEGYLDCAATSNFSVVGVDQALVWTIAGPADDAYGPVEQFDDLYGDIEKEVNDHMVRFIAHDQYLNGQNQGSTGGLRGGKGAWSFNYVYNANYSGSDVVGVGTVLAPQHTPAVYNLSGQRISRPAKGINIIGGRRVLVK